MNVNSIYNVQAYGAVGNGVTDDSAAEQAAIDAACAASSVGAPATVYWPAPSSFYATCSPLFVHCSGLRLQGAGAGTYFGGSGHAQAIQFSTSCPPVGGPAFVFQGYGMTGVALGAPIISGSTNSANFDGTTKYYVNLSDALSANSNSITLNGSAAFTLDAYVKLTTTADGDIVFSEGRKATYLNPTYAFALYISGTQFTAKMTVNGVNYGLTDTTTVLAANTLYDEQLTFDGTTIRLFTNGAMVASAAHSGTLTQPYWETVTVGGNLADWPDGSDLSNAINGLIDGVQISNVARHTTNFTPCNCEPTNDSNSAVVASFDQNQHMLTKLLYGTGLGEWSYARRNTEPGGGSEGVNAVTGIEMDGISYYGRFGSFGIIGQDFTNSNIRHTQFNNMEYGVYEYSTDFENTFDGDFFEGSQLPFYAGLGSGIQHLAGGTELEGGIACLRAQTVSLTADGLNCISSTTNIWAYSIQGDSGYGYLAANGLTGDIENCGAGYLGFLQLDNVEAAAFNGGYMAACPSTPVVEIDGGSNHGSANFTGVNFTPAATSPEVIHVASSNAPGIATVIGPYKGSAAPWTDSPADVVVNAGANTIGLLASTTGGISNMTPAVSSCGTGAGVAAGGTSNAFVITVGSTNPTTSCAVSFGSAANFANIPVCTAQDISQGFALKQSSLSTSGLTLTAPASVRDMHGDTINAECIGK